MVESAMIELSIAEVADRFPGFRVAFGLLEGLGPVPRDPGAVETYVRGAAAEMSAVATAAWGARSRWAVASAAVPAVRI